MIDIIGILNQMALSYFVLGHTFTELTILLMVVYLCYRYGITVGVLGALLVMVVHEYEYIIVYTVRGYPDPLAFLNFNAGGAAFWTGIGLVFYVFFRGSRFVIPAEYFKQMGYFAIAMSPYLIAWLSIGLPVYTVGVAGPSPYFHVPWVNALSILSWVYAAIAFVVVNRHFGEKVKVRK